MGAYVRKSCYGSMGKKLLCMHPPLNEFDQLGGFFSHVAFVRWLTSTADWRRDVKEMRLVISNFASEALCPNNVVLLMHRTPKVSLVWGDSCFAKTATSITALAITPHRFLHAPVCLETGITAHYALRFRSSW